MSTRGASIVLGGVLVALAGWFLAVLTWGPALPICHDSLNFLYEALRLPAEHRIGSYVHGPFLYELIAAMETGFYAVLRLSGVVHSPADHLVHVISKLPEHMRGVEALMALGGCATVVQMYRVGRLFGGPAVGAAAALLCAANATFVIMTSFAKEDVFFWFFMLLAMEHAWKAAEERSTRASVWAGIAIGCAMATKYFAIFTLVLVLLPLIRAPRAAVGQSIRLGVIMGLASGITLIVLFPFMFTDTAAVLRAIHDTNSAYSDMGTALAMNAYLRYHLPNVVGWVVMAAGAIEALRRIVTDPRGPHLLLAAPALLFLFVGLRSGFSLSYYAGPMALALMILASSLVAVVASKISLGPAGRAAVWVAASLTLLTAPYLPGAIKYGLLLTGPETRVLARDAVESRARSGDCVVVNLGVAGENLFGPPLTSTTAPPGRGPFTNARAIANQRATGAKFDVRVVDWDGLDPAAVQGCEWVVVGYRGETSHIELGTPAGTTVRATPPDGYEKVAEIKAFPEEHSRNYPLFTALDYDALRAHTIVEFLRDRSMGPSFDIYRRTAHAPAIP